MDPDESAATIVLYICRACEDPTPMLPLPLGAGFRWEADGQAVHLCEPCRARLCAWLLRAPDLPLAMVAKNWLYFQAARTPHDQQAVADVPDAAAE